MDVGEDAFDLVVPTIGRASLATLLAALDDESAALPERLILVDDREDPSTSLPVPLLSSRLASRVYIVRSRGRGPAAARNAGWRVGSCPWVAFLDDDVLPASGWLDALGRDLAEAAPDVAGTQGRVAVPLPRDRAATDWERNVSSLERAPWITADMAYRRDALAATGGFDERFRRAYREDTDLALRVQALGWRLVRGNREVLHPLQAADAFVSLRLQRGNADDALMTALHPGYRDGPTTLGRRPWHAATVGTLAGSPIAFAAGAAFAGAALLLCWAALTGALAWRRIAPGPRTVPEVATMLVTTAALPFAACAWWLIGVARLPRLLTDEERAPRPDAVPTPARSGVEAAP